MILDGLHQVPEDKRLIIRSAVARINDIANTLLTKAKQINFEINTAEEAAAKPFESSEIIIDLIPALVDVLVSEKRVQFRDKSKVEIESDFGDSYGAFARVNPTELKRVLSNLINNAVEAFSETGGRVLVAVRAYHSNVQIIVKDNGKGIPQHILEKLGKEGLTHGKEGTQSGSGLGVYHAKTTIESFGGSFQINSRLSEGTIISISIPRTETPEWFVSEIKLSKTKTVVIVDDDSSIHQIWQDRIKSLQVNIPILNFTSGPEFKKWFFENKNENQIFLMDFELLDQPQTGLDLIEELQIAKQSVLVTSRYDEFHIRKRTQVMSLKLIPKGMAGFTPIKIIEEIVQTRYDAILIDDDPLVHMTWEVFAKDSQKAFKGFLTFEQFEIDVKGLSKDSCVYIDANLADGVRGEDISEKVAALGFAEIYIATGYAAEDIRKNSIIKGVVGKDPLF